jgi:hypothetical protein
MMNRHPAQPGKTCLIDAPDSLVIGRLEFELSDQPSESNSFHLHDLQAVLPSHHSTPSQTSPST